MIIVSLIGEVGIIMPAQEDQTAQLLQKTLETPINTLAVILAILVVLVVIGILLLFWKFGPMILKQIQQQIDTNTKLTDAYTDLVTTHKQISEQRKQEHTEAITEYRNQTTVLRDIKNFQKLNNDQVADVGTKMVAVESKVETLSQTLDGHSERIDGLKAFVETRFDTIGKKLEDLMNKRDDCPDLKGEWVAFKSELLAMLEKQQPANAVSTSAIDTSTEKVA